MIDRRALLAALLAAPLAAMTAALALSGPAHAQKAAAPLSAEDQALVAKASAYLENLGEVKGRFVQTNPRGTVTQGDLFIKRPGRARFAYDPPSGLLVVSDGHNVMINDQRLKTFDQYPLSFTPLSLFLAKHIRLDKGVVVTRVERSPGGFTITARDGRKEAEGQITLGFADDPVALREWALTDGQGRTTRVAITALAPAPLDGGLFILRDPRPRGSGSGK